jgi:PAS domain S-box-containing protein
VEALVDKLINSELRYRRLFESAQDGILILNAETGLIEDVNPYLIKMLGYSREEFIKKRLWEVGAFRDIEANKEAFEALQKNEYIRYEDLPLKAKDGRLIQVEFVSNVYQVGKEKVIQCNIRDITARKRAEYAVRDSEKEFHSLAEAMPQIVWITRPDGWNIYFNQQWVDYTGLTLEESYGEGWNKPFHPDDQQRAWETWQNATKNGGTYSLECRLRRADGVYNWWLIRGVPVLDAQGTILKWFGTCTDINEIKKAEETLRLNEEKYRALVDEVNDGFYESDGSGVFTFANPALARIYGFESPEALIGRKFADFLAPEMPAGIGHAYGSAMQTGSSPKIIKGQVIRPDGTSAFIELKPAMIIRGDQIVGTRGVVRDITERKQAEERIQRQLQHLTALSAIDRVIAANFDLRLSLSHPCNEGAWHRCG